MEITESKAVYNEFKFWKDRYTTINRSSSVVILPNDTNCIKLVLSTPEDYYYLEGSISASGNKFIEWVNSTPLKAIYTNIESINIIRSCLKKNTVKLFYTDNSFIYEYLDKETGENKLVEFLKKDLSKETVDGNMLRSKFIYNTSLSSNLFKNEIFEVYLTEENIITETKTNNKVLEIPSAKILSVQKADNTEYTLYLSERNNRMQRLVGIESTNAQAGMSFLQIFNTI